MNDEVTPELVAKMNHAVKLLSVGTHPDHVQSELGLTQAEMAELLSDNDLAKKLARQHAPKAILTLVRNAEQADDIGASTKAAEALLNRAYGKPTEHVEHFGGSTIKIEWAGPDRLSYRNQVIDVTPAPAPTQLVEQTAPQVKSKIGRTKPLESAPPKAFKPVEQTIAQAMRDIDAAAGKLPPIRKPGERSRKP